MTNLQRVMERLLSEAEQQHPDIAVGREGERYNQRSIARQRRAEYVIRELKREVIRDTGLLTELGIHRDDLV